MSTSPDETAPRRRRGGSIRAGAGLLVCPRCGIPLRNAEHKLGIAWRCGVCLGQSLNFSQFRRMVPEKGANSIWMEAIVRPVTPGESTACPECQADMDAVRIPFRGRMVELDICRSCQRLWLDRQETPGGASLSLADSPGEGQSSAAARQELDRLLSEMDGDNERRPDRRVFSRKHGVLLFVAAAGGFTFAVLHDTSVIDRLWASGIAMVAAFAVQRSLLSRK